jgi:hypothetical protein
VRPERGKRAVGVSVLSVADALRSWHEFYALLGTASATMVGLLFVAASVGSGVFTPGRRAALRVFLSASVVNFSLVLAASLIVLAPITSWPWLGAPILVCGLFGLTHSCLAWRDSLREGLIHSIDLEDRIWYLALPIVGYVCMATSGVLLIDALELGCAVLAVSIGLLLGIGIHNAWDITIWIITRRQE